ncbi:fibronectin type III domain-containing protein [bacterium]|nr:fibronectin type III domain-containing protein [bacterium]
MAAGLDGLKAGSIAGPGWHSIELTGPGLANDESGVVPNGADLKFGGEQACWKLWAVSGWDGDNAPTSLRSTVESLSGTYHLGWTDYVDGRWHFSEALSGDGEAEFDPAALHPSQSDNISRFGRIYIAVISSPGSSFTLTSLQLGVDSGGRAPAALSMYRQSTAGDHVRISWDPSPDAWRPDFAGYVVERRNWQGGDWLALMPEPINVNYFVDLDSEPGEIYMYRVNSFDRNGNFSYGVERRYYTFNGDATPVPVIRMPVGPLLGPAEVEIDMSGSFDPDGTPIDEYEINFGYGMPVSKSAAAVQTFTLQPGCYRIDFRITSNMRTQQARRYLKVYPQWEGEAGTAIEATPEFARADGYDASCYPAGGSTLICRDLLVPGITAVSTAPDGSDSWKFLPLPFTGDFRMSRLTDFHSQSVFAVSGDSYFKIYSWNGATMELFDSIEQSCLDNRLALASDGADELWVFYFSGTAPNYTLVAQSRRNYQSKELATGLSATSPIRAVYNPVSDQVDIVILAPNLTMISMDRELNATSHQIAPVPPQYYELCEVPQTGRPAVLFFDGIDQLYTEMLDEDLNWSFPSVLDPQNSDYPEARLLASGGEVYAIITDHTEGRTRVWQRSESGWGILHELQEAKGGVDLATCRLPNGQFRIYEQGASGAVRLYAAGDSAPPDPVFVFESTSFEGSQLHALADSSQMHIVSQGNSAVQHYLSTNGTDYSADDALDGFSHAQLGVLNNGDFRLCARDGNSTEVWQWIGGAWSSTYSSPINDDCWPQFCQYSNEYLGFDVSNLSAGKYRYSQYGLPPVDFLFGNGPVWDGYAIYGNGQAVLMRAGGVANSYSTYVIFVAGSNQKYQLWQTQTDFDRSYEFATRGMDGAAFTTNDSSPARFCWHVHYGFERRPQRIEFVDSKDISAEYLPGWEELSFTSDPHITVSDMQANSQTNVSLTAANSEARNWFEWSNFGEWEQLPLPLGGEDQRWSRAELATGPDGRWYIFWLDLISGDVKYVRTI